MLAPLLALALAAAPPAVVEAAARELPAEDDAAAIQDLTTGELILAHHPEALGRAHPSGSTLKLIAAYAALASGGEAPRLRYRCAGKASVLGRPRECWLKGGHGPMDLDRALADSCNLYFYELGARLEPAAWLEAARLFGLGRSTGAPVPVESEGELPRALTQEELSDAAAGEGEHLRVTPLQLLGLASAIATGGERVRPVAAGRPREVLGRVPDGAALRRLAEDMRRAVRTGTLADSGLESLGAAGKTGTARWARGYHTHGWFVGFVPEGAPRYAIAVFVGTGQGASHAGRAARGILEALLRPGAAPPPRTVRVRVLERLHPERLRLQPAPNAAATCDGEPLSEGELRLRADGARITVEGGARVESCARVRVEGLTAVPLPGEEPRRYPGGLQLTSRGRELEVINEAPLEDYVAGVVASEAATDRPAALEAQAVVSRTFAVRERGRHGAAYDLCDLTHCQAYRGAAAPGPARKAAEATRGLVLREHGEAIHAYFHSTCGGRTASAERVLGDPPDPALAGVSDLDPHGQPWCQASPHLAWRYAATRAALARAVGGKALDDGVRILERDPSGTATRLRAYGVTLSGEAFKSRLGRAFGWQSLRSARFEVTQQGEQVTFTGRGLGHGVGLCQYGAAGQAAAGKSAREILGHYFPGAQVEDVDAR